MMSIKKMYYVLYLILCVPLTAFPESPHAKKFLDRTILNDSAVTQELLTECGFKKICFSTQDNLKLCGLFLDKSCTQKVTRTILYCAGFYPGKKEGMSSFYALVADEPYNILMFDARGHHESEGSLWSYQSLKNYGLYEYRDIVAAIRFIDQYNKEHGINSDIIIHGICSGAFHAIKAVEYMTNQACPECSSIKGIIFDSGWLKISDVIESTIQAEVNNKLKSTYVSWLAQPLTWITQNLYKITLQKHHNQQPNIQETITKISIPIWFVHCTDDPYIPIDPVIRCVCKCNTQEYWWIEHDSHANYHLENHTAYQEQLLRFLRKV